MKTNLILLLAIWIICAIVWLTDFGIPIEAGLIVVQLTLLGVMVHRGFRRLD